MTEFQCPHKYRQATWAKINKKLLNGLNSMKFREYHQRRESEFLSVEVFNEWKITGANTIRKNIILQTLLLIYITP